MITALTANKIIAPLKRNLMKQQSTITDIIFDYDGTCTQIPLLYEGFLKSYFEGFAKQMEQLLLPITYKEWQDAVAIVRSNSPLAGWTVKTCPSAPAAADPYILAFETACFILRNKKSSASPDFKIFGDAYATNPPSWRDDAASTFIALQQKGVKLHFISNSSTTAIRDQLKKLTGVGEISVDGGAAKFSICELVWDPQKAGDEMPAQVKKKFTDLPACCTAPEVSELGRLAYLRRGSYFEAIYRALGNDLSKLATTVFCGDVWELDLSMPYTLGANVHLIERASPFDTYAYERAMVSSYGNRGKIGKNLSDVLQWF